MKKSEYLLKTVGIYLVYFLYTYFVSYIGRPFSEVDNQLLKMIFDCFFIIFAYWLYHKNLKEDLDILKKEYKLKKTVKIIGIAIIGTIVINIVLAIVEGLLFPNSVIDQNTEVIQNMANISVLYTVFKTLIFSSFAEEILFREALSECVDNNMLFIVISALIYTGMNFVFTSGDISIIQILAYFLPAVWFSYLYTKNKRNVFLIMITKFVYNLIPLAILLLGV